MDNVWPWLQAFFDGVLAALSPVNAINAAAEWGSAMLPLPNTSVIGVLQQLPAAFNLFLSYISWLDYFVDLQLLVTVLFLILSTESSLLVVRLWRVARSFIT
jgi:hypothetical protein